MTDHKVKDNKWSIAVDFDGVIHSYTTPWTHEAVIADPPVPGAIEWLCSIAEWFTVIIFTTRGKTDAGRVAVADWLSDHGYPCEAREVTAVKPAALIYLDDRAVRFDGRHFPTKNEIHRLRPWNKGESA